jgi:hypothetical protein
MVPLRYRIRPKYWFRTRVFVSYPKSGRTWLRYVLDLVGCKVKFTHAGHGTANVREIGEPFVAPMIADLGHKNIFR